MKSLSFIIVQPCHRIRLCSHFLTFATVSSYFPRIQVNECLVRFSAGWLSWIIPFHSLVTLSACHHVLFKSDLLSLLCPCSAAWLEKVWKCLLVFPCQVTQSGETAPGRRAQMRYSDLSTWYSVAISQHVLQPHHPTLLPQERLWCFPNEWNFVSGGQQLTRLILSQW